jgi:ubiquinone/menaquinone biosynthesis C-methylase UbiE
MIEQEYYEHFAASMDDAEVERRLARGSAEMRRFDPLLAEIPQGIASLLDVGCGPGILLATLRRERPALRAVGVERSAGLGSTGRRLFGVEILRGSIEQLPFSDRSFDAVVASEVIEHLPYGVYERGLAELQRVARQIVVITVPFRERRESARCPYCGCHFDPNFHMRRYDEASLAGLLDQFPLLRTVPICVKVSVLSGAAAAIGRWKRALSRTGFFPPCGICPQCGFFLKAPDCPQQHPGTRRWEQWKQALRRRLPQTSRVRWMLAIYQRRTQPQTATHS